MLRAAAAKIFVVTINGAKVGSKSWTEGLIMPLDQGDFDNRQLLATLREIGYRGPIGVMCYGIPGDARRVSPALNERVEDVGGRVEEGLVEK